MQTETIGCRSPFSGFQSKSHENPPLPDSSRGLENWTTINEELYNNIRVHESAKPLATGKQEKAETVVAWTHEYGEGKTRVFSTTLGHNNETVADARFLDLVTRGLLWACGKLDKDGKPAEGYGAPAAK